MCFFIFNRKKTLNLHNVNMLSQKLRKPANAMQTSWLWEQTLELNRHHETDSFPRKDTAGRYGRP